MLSPVAHWIPTKSRSRFYVFGIVCPVAAAAALLLAQLLAPWLYAINVHVKLHLSAPSETKLEVCWDKSRSQCLPLVPYLSAQDRIANAGETADLWLSELPARPSYTISLNLESSITGGVFQDLELDSWPTMLWGYIPGAGVQNTKIGLDQMGLRGIAYSLDAGVVSITGDVGDRLMVTRDISPGPSSSAGRPITVWLLWGLLFSAFLLIAIPIWLLPFAVQNADLSLADARPLHYSWWLLVICGLAVPIMLLLVMNSPVMFGGDSMFYLPMAIRGDWLNPARPPGYWIFLAGALHLSGDNLAFVVLLQAIVTCLSAAICVWALRTRLHPLVAVLVFVGVLFSPAQLRWALFIMRDSLFAALVLVAVAALTAHVAAESRQSQRIWLVVFSIACALALLVRENGVVLPMALLPVVLPQAIKRLTSPGKLAHRVLSLWSYSARYLAAVLPAVAVFLGFCSYHYLRYGSFQFTMYAKSHRSLWSEMATASFDSRSLLEPGPSMDAESESYLGPQLYRSYIAGRQQRPTVDQIIAALWPALHGMMSERGVAINWFRSASILDEIGRSAKTLLSHKADLVGVLRQYMQFLFVSSSDSGAYSIQPDDPAGLAVKQQMLAQLERKITYAGSALGADDGLGGYFHVPERYDLYLPLLYVALLAGWLTLRYDHPVFAVPLALFLSNAALMIILRTETSRYIESLDVLLILQIGLAISRWIDRRPPRARAEPHLSPP